MEYIKNMILFLVFMAFIENILISEQAKKYLKLFCGIVLIFLTLQWVGKNMGKDIDINEIMNINERYIDLDEINSVLMDEDYGEIEKEISNIVALEGYKLDNISVQSENDTGLSLLRIYISKSNQNISIDRISLDGEEKNNEKSIEVLKIRDKISEKYNLDISFIDVIVD